MTTDDFPCANMMNPEHVKDMKENADMLREDIAGGGYTKKKHETEDKRQLKKVEKWLALVK